MHEPQRTTADEIERELQELLLRAREDARPDLRRPRGINVDVEAGEVERGREKLDRLL